MNEIAYSLTLFFTVILVAFILSVISYCCTSQFHPESQQHSSEGVDTRSNIDVASESNQTLTAVTVETCRPDQTRVFSYNDPNNKLLCSSSQEAKLCDDKDGGDVSSSCCCSICLTDYRESDLVRVLPDCGHFFHVKCVDPWITIHLTCPICRSLVTHF